MQANIENQITYAIHPREQTNVPLMTMDLPIILQMKLLLIKIAPHALLEKRFKLLVIRNV
jgi:hypothetical protein